MKKNLQILMLLLIYIMTLIGNGTVHANDMCGFDHTAQQLLQEKYTNQYARIAAGNCERPTDVTMIFPVVIHVVNTGNTNLIPTSQIDSARARINRDFKNVNGFGPDSKINFVLAKRDTNGNACSGINYIDGTQLPQYVQYGMKSSGSSGNGCSYEQLTQFNWPIDQYINVFIVNTISNGISGTIGNNNLIIKKDYFSENWRTFAHEMGHYFSLRHTFSETGNCWQNDDCANQGDLVCDTPPYKLNETPVTGSVCYNGDISNSYNNVMGNSMINSRFTSGQVDRMRVLIYGYLWSVVLSEAQIPTTVGNEVSLDAIENNSVNLCDGAFIPQITIRNLGVNIINSVTVETYIDDVLVNTSNITGVGLISKGVKTINLNSITGVSAGTHNIKCVITKINGATGDYFSLNNSVCGSLYFYNTNYSVNLYSDNGSVSGSGTYTCGSMVNISTSPNNPNDYRFVNWTDDNNGNTIISTVPNHSFVAQQNYAFSANYERIIYTINTSSNNSNAGITTVSSGNKYYNYSVTVNANLTNNCYQFINWTENGNIVSTSPSYTFSITGDRNLIANYIVKIYTVSATVTPINAGVVSGLGSLNCGTNVNIVAHAQSGFQFVNWIENGVVVSTDTVLPFTIGSNRNLIANFTVLTGILDHKTETVSIYPNPATDLITIKGSFYDPQITIRDVSGRQYQINYSQNINISSFPSGMYIIEIIDDDKVYLGKVIKK